MRVVIKNGAAKLVEEMRNAQAVAIATIADMAKQRLNRQKPSEPARGSMRWVSARQERFVKMMFASGKMHLYERGRGNGLPWQSSKNLNRSYVVMRDTTGGAAIISTAPYAQYVVGDQQSQIHQGRWKTAQEVAEEMEADGTINRVITDAINHVLK